MEKKLSINKYVVGFAFSEDGSHVALIRKSRPAWQAGKLNGVGGKIEPGESPIDAIVREFLEETGVDSSCFNWRSVGRLYGDNFELFVFSAFHEFMQNVVTTTDEIVEVVKTDLNYLRDEGISNLSWLVAAALDRDSSRFNMDVEYQA